jgi:hypothetical protein
VVVDGPTLFLVFHETSIFMRVLDAPRKFESFYTFKKNHSAFAPKDKTTEVCINLYWNPLCTIAKHMGHMMHRVSVRPLSWGVENPCCW